MSDHNRDDVATSGEVTVNTRTTFITAAAIALGLFTGWKSLNDQALDNRRFFEKHITEVRHDNELLQGKVDGLKLLVQEAAADRWTKTNMRLWRELAEARNPEVDFPHIPE